MSLSYHLVKSDLLANTAGLTHDEAAELNDTLGLLDRLGRPRLGNPADLIAEIRAVNPEAQAPDVRRPLPKGPIPQDCRPFLLAANRAFGRAGIDAPLVYSAYRHSQALAAGSNRIVRRRRVMGADRALAHTRSVVGFEPVTQPINEIPPLPDWCSLVLDLLAAEFIGFAGGGAVNPTPKVATIEPNCVLAADLHTTEFSLRPVDKFPVPADAGDRVVYFGSVEASIGYVTSWTEDEIRVIAPPQVLGSARIGITPPLPSGSLPDPSSVARVADFLGIPPPVTYVEPRPRLDVVGPTVISPIHFGEPNANSTVYTVEPCRRHNVLVSLATDDGTDSVAQCVRHRVELFGPRDLLLTDFLSAPGDDYVLLPAFHPCSGPHRLRATPIMNGESLPAVEVNFTVNLEDRFVITRLDGRPGSIPHGATTKLKVELGCGAGTEPVEINIACNKDWLRIPNKALIPAKSRTVEVSVTSLRPISAANRGTAILTFSTPGTATANVELEYRPPRVGLALAGGGLKGSFHAGALGYLATTGVLSNLDCVAGASVGSLNALRLVLGSNDGGFGQRVRAIQTFWLDVGEFPSIIPLKTSLEAQLSETVELTALEVDAAREGDFGRLMDLVGGLDAFLPRHLNFVTEAFLAIDMATIDVIDKLFDDNFEFGDIGRGIALIPMIGLSLLIAPFQKIFGAADAKELLDKAKKLNEWNASNNALFTNQTIQSRMTELTKGLHPTTKLRMASSSLTTGEVIYCDERSRIRRTSASAAPEIRANGSSASFGATVAVGLVRGALASSAFPLVFSPQKLSYTSPQGPRVHQLFDGGHQELIPNQACVDMDADYIFSIPLSPIGPSKGATDAPPTIPDVLLRSVSVLHSEVGSGDLEALSHAETLAAPPLVIAPKQSVVGTFEVSSGKTRINMSYGWMRAFDEFNSSNAALKRTAESITSERLAIRRAEAVVLSATVALSTGTRWFGLPVSDTWPSTRALKQLHVAFADVEQAYWDAVLYTEHYWGLAPNQLDPPDGFNTTFGVLPPLDHDYQPTDSDFATRATLVSVWSKTLNSRRTEALVGVRAQKRALLNAFEQRATLAGQASGDPIGVRFGTGASRWDLPTAWLDWEHLRADDRALLGNLAGTPWAQLPQAPGIPDPPLAAEAPPPTPPNLAALLP